MHSLNEQAGHCTLKSITAQPQLSAPMGQKHSIFCSDGPKTFVGLEVGGTVGAFVGLVVGGTVGSFVGLAVLGLEVMGARVGLPVGVDVTVSHSPIAPCSGKNPGEITVCEVHQKTRK
jgi:hypothetical protein